MAGRRNIFAHQPVKALYTIYYMAALAFVKLPFAFVYYLPRRLRPVPTWDCKASVTIYLVKLLFYYASVVEYKEKTPLEPGKEGKRFITIQPAADNLYTGVLKDEHIKPETIGAVWYPTEYSEEAARDKKIILHFHAGAYVLLNSRDVTYGNALPMLSKQFGDAMVLCPEYRLATSATGRFPAQLQDAVTAYQYLLHDRQIEPSRIIFSGDSAGGHLVIGLLRHLVNQPSSAASLPFPAGALLLSPWVDIAGIDELDQSKNRRIDFIEPCLLHWGAQALTDHARIPLSDPYISPLQAPFKVPIPIWTLVAGVEVFYESIHSFVDSMRAAGNRIQLCEVPNATHDVFVSYPTFGLQPVLEEAMQQARRWIEEDSH